MHQHNNAVAWQRIGLGFQTIAYVRVCGKPCNEECDIFMLSHVCFSLTIH